MYFDTIMFVCLFLEVEAAHKKNIWSKYMRLTSGQNRVFLVFLKCSEIQFSRLNDLKKGRQNFRIIFENCPPPLEKILDPPLVARIYFVMLNNYDEI